MSRATSSPTRWSLNTRVGVATPEELASHAAAVTRRPSKDALPLRRLFEYLEPARLSATPELDVTLDLPEEYVAVRFYFSQCFPETNQIAPDSTRSCISRPPPRGSGKS